MFYIFCDLAILAAAVGIAFSISSQIRYMRKKRGAKSHERISNAFGVSFIVCMIATTLCFFAGY